MNTLGIEIENGKTSFRHGETLRGTARWSMEESPRNAEIRLIWFTEGRGTQDVEVIDTVPLPSPAPNDSRQFSFNLPLTPSSFSGTLSSLVWACELIVGDGSDAANARFDLTFTGEKIVLQKVPDEPKKTKFRVERR